VAPCHEPGFPLPDQHQRPRAPGHRDAVSASLPDVELIARPETEIFADTAVGLRTQTLPQSTDSADCGLALVDPWAGP
jgi:hypothetical protein